MPTPDEQKLLIDLQFLPTIEYFVALVKYENVVFDLHEHFVKQTYRNRCYILGANGVIRLIVPMANGSQKKIMQHAEVDYSHEWVAPLWKSIQSAYGRSPFFEFFAPDLRQILYEKHRYLATLNDKLLSFCLKCLEIDRKLVFTEEYLDSSESSIVDLRSTIHPKTDYRVNGLYRPVPYIQIFGKKFVPNISIVDLLFCEGPNAKTILQKSQVL